ncbi:MAG TPA: PIN domain-containing protein [Nitrososphaerales archaeon]|nr:PIN domain-containing protein [Nitrososphaerales archaeon]
MVDTSALYPMLIRMSSDGSLKLLPRLTIMDLTKYELGNVVLYDRKVKDASKLLSSWQIILDSMNKEEARNMKEVYETASKNNVTFYDGAYVQVAKASKCKLVTMDAEIVTKFKELTLDPDDLANVVSE